MCSGPLPHAWRSDGHLSRAVGGVALLLVVVVVGRLGWLPPLHVLPPLYVLPLDVLLPQYGLLPRPRAPSTCSIHPSVGLAKEVLHVLYTPLPPGGVAVPPAGALRGGGGVCRGGGLSLDVAPGRLPGFEGRAGEQRVRGGFGQARLLRVVGGDGDGEGGVEVVVRRHGLVDVGFLFVLHGHGLEAGWGHRLVLGEVHEREALVVGTRRAVRCNGGEEARKSVIHQSAELNIRLIWV